MDREEGHRQSLEDEVDNIIKESRMVLPGIQALFGFQLIVVFSESFSRMLPFPARVLHLSATFLIACAIALIMAPAAFHRQAQRDRVTRYFAEYASTMVTIAMIPLLVALAIEISLIAYAITQSVLIACVLGIVLGSLYLGLWFVYPRLHEVRTRRG